MQAAGGGPNFGKMIDREISERMRKGGHKRAQQRNQRKDDRTSEETRKKPLGGVCSVQLQRDVGVFGCVKIKKNAARLRWCCFAGCMCLKRRQAHGPPRVPATSISCRNPARPFC